MQNVTSINGIPFSVGIPKHTLQLLFIRCVIKSCHLLSLITREI